MEQHLIAPKQTCVDSGDTLKDALICSECNLAFLRVENWTSDDPADPSFPGLMPWNKPIVEVKKSWNSAIRHGSYTVSKSPEDAKSERLLLCTLTAAQLDSLEEM